MRLVALCKLSHQGASVPAGGVFNEPSEHSARKLIKRGCAALTAPPKKPAKKKAKATDE